MTFRNQDFTCPDCGKEIEVFLDLRDMNEEQREKALSHHECPLCEGDMVRAWKPGHGGLIGREGTDETIAKMKKSYQKRFIKKEIDDVRHKKGRLFDDSLRTGAVERIKKEIKGD